jgi:membrane-bound lytic murein transglycosylase D
LFFHSSGFGQVQTKKIFPVPVNLKDNVAFWKKIYTGVSLTEGLIHDREYPLIIYQKLKVGDRKGKDRNRFIKKHINLINQHLKNILSKPEMDLNQREKQIFSLFKEYATIDELKSAKSRIRFQSGQKERFKQGLERSGAYIRYIKKIFDSYQIPKRIIYLPHVESSFNINAYSKVGAAGMWQFMRGTGRYYLKVNYMVDERRDPVKSTIAAAKHLKRNYQELKSWPLAITAYNHGLASIKRAVKVTGTRDIGVIIEKYKNRRFRFASKNFYSCFLAASDISMKPELYFPDLKYDPPFEYNELTLTSYIKPNTLAKYLKIALKRLAELNPGLRTTVFRKGISIPKGYMLRIPKIMSPEEAQTLISSIPKNQKSTKSDKYYYYQVQRGDNLFRISKKYRVSLESILMVNPIPHERQIFIGQVLKIPNNTRGNKKKKKQNLIAKVEKANGKGLDNNKSKEIRTKEDSIAPKADFIEVREAEDLPDVSKTPNKKYDEAFDATLYGFDIQSLKGKNGSWIKVAVDETLGHYSDWMQVSTWRIRKLNQLGRRSIKVNQRIQLPLSEENIEDFNKKRLEYHMALEEDFYNQYQVTDVKSRKVKYGETLWSICNEEEEIPLWLFKKFNREIDIEKIRVNTEIIIPVIKEK